LYETIIYVVGVEMAEILELMTRIGPAGILIGKQQGVTLFDNK